LTWMNDNGLSAAIAALFTVGVLLLNLGANMIQGDQLINGLLLITFGVFLILVAVLIIKVMIKKVVTQKTPRGSRNINYKHTR